MAVQKQAALLSYIDVFWLFAIAVAVLIPVALLLLRPVSQTSPQSVH